MRCAMRHLLSLVLILFVSSVAKADFYSLCIGTSADEDKMDKKYRCVFNKDAVVMSKMLKKKGANTKLLYGWVATEDIYREVEALSKKATDKDTTFIFFSMHGDSRPDDFALITYDGAASGKKVICLASKIKGRVIIAADTCCAGAILKCNAKNVLLIGSSKEDQSAYWIKKLPRKEPCGYLTRPLYNVFSKTLNPTVEDMANEMNKVIVPNNQTLWYSNIRPESVLAVVK